MVKTMVYRDRFDDDGYDGDDDDDETEQATRS